jgi:type I restriction enzyme, S subunit
VVANERKAFKLDEFGFVGRGKSRHRPRNDPSLYGGIYPFFQTADIKEAELYLSKHQQTYNERGLAQSKLWKPGTLCITIAANIAETAILKVEGCFPDSVVGFIPDLEKADVRFIKYYIDTIKMNMQSVSRGTTQDNLSLDKLLSFDFLVPKLSDQKRIASILSAYDDLIENNTRRIKILEEMAQRIYKEWFVDFRFPGHEKVKFVDSELGRIPSEWIHNYAEVVDFKEGPGLRNWQYRDRGIPFLNIRTLVNNDVDLNKVNYLDEGEVFQKYQHFLLEAYDHVVSSSGTLGRLVTIQEIHLPLMLNTSIIRMRPLDNSIGKWQLKHFLLSPYFQNQINSFATGSAQKNYGPIHLKKMWIIKAGDETGNRYEELIGPLEEHILVLVHKNRILRQTRDLLLPKLISGEIDVSEMPDPMEAAAA